jgi:hypothetical protein
MSSFDSRQRLAVGLVVLVALLFRVDFALTAHTSANIAGDINDYANYARNLLTYGIYSSHPPTAEALPPADRFRPPGYPLFLAVAMLLSRMGGEWTAWATALQVAVSTATVLLTVLLGRQWMKPAWAVAAGGLLAVWPHNVVMASTLLSETLFGFLIVVALWLTCLVGQRGGFGRACAAGLALGLATLVNSLIAPFALACMALVAWRQRARLAAAMLACFLALPAAWVAVAPAMPEGRGSATDRVLMNLVQGAWPQYHPAWRTRHNNAISRQILQAIDAEIRATLAAPASGLLAVGQRLAADPARSATWYLLHKPYALWDWQIQVGWKDIYFLQTPVSPYQRQPALRVTYWLTRLANPALLALATVCALLCLARLARKRQVHAIDTTALLFVYVTLVHTVLQAEPRYSVAYRPEQLLLAVSLLAMFFNRRANRAAPSAPSAPHDGGGAAPHLQTARGAATPPAA